LHHAYVLYRIRCKSTVRHFLNNGQLSPEQEMVQDLLTIVDCFSARLYGLRNYRKKLSEVLAADVR
jgi:predicted site-specific integrase-resolvase